MLAKFLSDHLKRTVEDATGVHGIFEFHIELDGRGTGRRDDRCGSFDLHGAREQLGFRLEARKGPVDVLVIDHVEEISVGEVEK
jgi:uncharacterized protein (TIGR03435 family)